MQCPLMCYGQPCGAQHPALRCGQPLVRHRKQLLRGAVAVRCRHAGCQLGQCGGLVLSASHICKCIQAGQRMCLRQRPAAAQLPGCRLQQVRPAGQALQLGGS